LTNLEGFPIVNALNIATVNIQGTFQVTPLTLSQVSKVTSGKAVTDGKWELNGSAT
jgi:hypothetical protein